MDINIEERMIDSANQLIYMLIEFADEKGLCKCDMLGTRKLKGIPLKWLIESVIASFDADVVQTLLVAYGAKVKNQSDFIDMENEIYTDVRNILETNFVSPVYVNDITKECVDIIGYQLPREKLIPLFIPIVLVDIIFYEKDRRKKDYIKTQFVENLYKAVLHKIVVGLDMSNDKKEQIDIDDWKNKANKYIEVKLAEEHARRKRVSDNIETLARNLDYLKKGEEA